MEELQEFLKRILAKPENAVGLCQFIGQLALEFAEVAGSEGATEFYLLKSGPEKVQYFEAWLAKFMQEQALKAAAIKAKRDGDNG